MPDSEYNLHIRSTNDATGTKSAESGLKDVTSAAKEGAAANEQHAASTQEVAHELGGMAKASKAGAIAGNLFTEALHGNFGALLHLGPLLKATKTAITATFAGLLTFGAGTLLTLFPTIIGYIRGMGEASKEAAPKTDAFAEALEKAGNAKLEVLSKALSELKAEAKGAADELKRVYDYHEKLIKARADVAKAEAETNQNLTPEEREKKLFEAEQGAVNKQRRLDKNHRTEEVAEAKKAMDDARAHADSVKAEQQKFIDSAEAGDTQAHNEQMEKRNLERELKKWEGVMGSDDPVAAAEASERVKAMKARIEQIEAGTGLKTQAGAQRARAMNMKPAVAEAEKEAAEAEAHWRDLAANEYAPHFEHGLEDRARRLRNHQPEPTTTYDRSKLMDQFGTFSHTIPESAQRAIDEARALNSALQEVGQLSSTSLRELAAYIHNLKGQVERQADELRNVQSYLKANNRGNN